MTVWSSIIAGAIAAASAWPADYEKREVLIPMRDGVRLHTSVYSPSDPTRPHPILLHRTPYSCAPYGPDRYPESPYLDPLLAQDGYVFVCQDVRGTHMSEGDWVHMRPHIDPKGPGVVDESTDAYDTIDWLLEHVPDHNGRVGIWGASYPGFYVAASLIDAHPALKCALPQAPQIDWWYEDVHHNGAFFLAPVFDFVAEFGLSRSGPIPRHPRFEIRRTSPDGYNFFLFEVGPVRTVNDRFFEGRATLWNDIVQHPNRDRFWRERDLRPHLRSVTPTVLNVGGWYDDSNLFGTLAAYRSIEERSPETSSFLVLGPWEHTGWEWNVEGDHHGEIDFGQPTSQFYRLEVQRPFLSACLLGDGDVSLPEALVFETGESRWRPFDAWPPRPAEDRWLYLAAEGALEWEPPEGTAFDAFRSDPAKPVPFTEEVLPGRSRTFMNADQRFASRRPDVVVYRTPPLNERLTLAGPFEAEIWVSTDRADADWVVKVIDEFPGDHPDWPRLRRGQKGGGYQMLVRAEVMRGRFRDDPSRPAPFEADRPTRVRFALVDVFHTFLPGHRVMLQIQSSWFPLVDRNPQSWVENIFEAEADDFVAATHRIYRSAEHPSRLRLSVLPAQVELAGQTERFHQDVAWSPDGKHIAFSQYAPDGDAYDYDPSRWGIFVATSDGTEQRQLVSNARWVSWSPDGRRLAFGSERAGNWDVYTIARDGSDERRITEDASDDGQPAWSPDGSALAFSSDRSGDRDIYLVTLDGSKRVRLTDDASEDYNPAWSPDGSHIVFFRERGDGMDQIHVVAADGSERWQVTRDTANNVFPSFIADGRIVFSSKPRDGREHLVITDPKGSGRLVLSEVDAFFARWSPDGSTIAFIAGEWPRSAIYLANADGSNIRKIVD